MVYIHAYNTAGTMISEGDGSAPLDSGVLNATNNEVSAPIKVTLKCDAGYKTYGNTTVSFIGTNAANWTVSATSTGTYAATLTITDVIDSVGKDIYVKAKAVSTENPSNDTTTDIQIATVIAAV